MLKIYNTLGREKQKFKPLRGPDVKFYACGPTVYNNAHLGNLCAYTFDDIVIRSLRFQGWRVATAMNITDVDDKTIRDSQEVGMNLKDFTQKYTDLFNADLKKLNITSFDKQKPISELVNEMIAMTQGLLNKGFAYLADDGSVYFSIEKSKGYGDLANLDMKGMKASVRIDNDEYEKDNVADFVLWKSYDPEKDGNNKWEAVFIVDGKEISAPGRPGWHIECSACSQWAHGDQIDIHMGGCDLVFPHHQNEIAQSEAVTGKEFCKYWMHTGHLLVDGKKMSKSKNNFYTLADILEKSEASEEMTCRAFRMMCLQNGYRQNFNFTFDRLYAGINTVENLDNFFKRILGYQTDENHIRREFRDQMQEFIGRFIEFLEDDIDTVNALTVVFDAVTYAHKQMDEGVLTLAEGESLIDLMESFDAVMGLMNFELLEPEDIAPELLELLDKRMDAKASQNFDLADSFRDQIKKAGYKIVDDKTGSYLEKLED